jgi:NADH-quinone oxidoreductase subunit J
MAQLLFFYFSGIIVLSAVLVVALKNPIYSVLSLLVAFFHVAGLYVLLGAEFLAGIQILVYAGAILALYLFVVQLLSLKTEERYHRQIGPAVVLGLLLLGEVAMILLRSDFSAPQGEFSPERMAETGNTEALGAALFNTFLLPFEVASVVLLVAMVGAIVLAKKGVIEKGEKT